MFCEKFGANKKSLTAIIISATAVILIAIMVVAFTGRISLKDCINHNDTTYSTPTEEQVQSQASEKTTVVYELPPDLSVYGTWQISDTVTMKISYGGSYTYTTLNGVWTGENGTIVCGEKALKETGLSYREVRMRYGVLPQNFNIDNFYYIYLPIEYVSFDGQERVPASADFQDCIAELYFYLWNDDDGELKAYSYLEREGEDSLVLTLDQIKGEE